VQFGLQFEPTDATPDAPAAADAPAPVHPLAPPTTSASTAPGPASLPVPAPSTAPENQDQAAKPGEGAEVVRLDRFRKK
jgi:hypothetical protein